MLGACLSHVLSLSLPLSFPLETSPYAAFCTKIALKLLSWRSLPGVIPGLGEAVSEDVSPAAAAGEGRAC